MGKLRFGLICLAVAALATYIGAQETQDKLKVNRPKIANTSNAPVTQAEAHETFTRIRKALVTARILTAPGKPNIVKGTASVTRKEVLLEMRRLLDEAMPKVKYAPKAIKYDAKTFKLKDPALLKAIDPLVKWGLVPKISPLTTGPRETLSVPEFGDAVGYFTSRLADVTHMPSPRWSPYLMPPGG